MAPRGLSQRWFQCQPRGEPREALRGGGVQRTLGTLDWQKCCPFFALSKKKCDNTISRSLLDSPIFFPAWGSSQEWSGPTLDPLRKPVGGRLLLRPTPLTGSHPPRCERLPPAPPRQGRGVRIISSLVAGARNDCRHLRPAARCRPSYCIVAQGIVSGGGSCTLRSSSPTQFRSSYHIQHDRSAQSALPSPLPPSACVF